MRISKTLGILLLLFFFFVACKDAKVSVKMNKTKSTPAPPTFQTNVGASVLVNGSHQLKAEVKHARQMVLTNGTHVLAAEVVR